MFGGLEAAVKKAVITGATGAIGIALVEYLAARGIEVTAVVRPGSARADRIRESELVHRVECDLGKLSQLPGLAGNEADVFYHLGWVGTFGNSRNDCYAQMKNVQYALEAVDAAKELGCSAFVGAGSQAEFGRYEGKLNAEVPVFPENGYGIAKLCAGQMTRLACEQKGIRHIWTRILSVYGPYDGSATMVMQTIAKLLDGQKPSCTKGEQKWDYLYAKDAAQALYLAGEKGRAGSVYCIGSGQARPLREYIEQIKDAIDPGLPVGFGEIPYAEKQVMYLCADIEPLARDTGFQPQYTFEEGIRETISWFREKLKTETLRI